MHPWLTWKQAASTDRSDLWSTIECASKCLQGTSTDWHLNRMSNRLCCTSSASRSTSKKQKTKNTKIKTNKWGKVYELFTYVVNHTNYCNKLKGWWMVNARLCQKARPVFSFVIWRHFVSFNCMASKRPMVKDHLPTLNKGAWTLIENDKLSSFWFVCLFVLDHVMLSD